MQQCANRATGEDLNDTDMHETSMALQAIRKKRNCSPSWQAFSDSKDASEF